MKHLAPRLMTAIDRAIALATTTLKYGRAEEALPRREVFALRPLVEEAACAALECQTAARFDNRIDPTLMADADREQLFRIVLNIVRNACEAVGGEGVIVASAARKDSAVEIEIGAGLGDAGEGFGGGGRAERFAAQQVGVALNHR